MWLLYSTARVGLGTGAGRNTGQGKILMFTGQTQTSRPHWDTTCPSCSPGPQSPALTHWTLLTPALADNSASGFHGFQAVWVLAQQLLKDVIHYCALFHWNPKYSSLLGRVRTGKYSLFTSAYTKLATTSLGNIYSKHQREHFSIKNTNPSRESCQSHLRKRNKCLAFIFLSSVATVPSVAKPEDMACSRKLFNFSSSWVELEPEVSIKT